MMKKYVYLLSIFIILGGLLLPGSVREVEARVPQPAQYFPPFQDQCQPGQPCQDVDGNWYILHDSRMMADAMADTKSLGGPDEFGYTWDDSVAYFWIDVSDGTNTGLTDYGQTGPITLPFAFPFYENAYSQIYITTPGYLTFHFQQVDGQSNIPDSREPNDVIAPFWAPNSPNTTNGWIRYKSGGIIPNRYFVVEWHQMEDEWGNTFTFEVILFENGNIKFQYKTIDLAGTSIWATSEGIEDSLGLDGLTYVNLSYLPPSNTAVLFSRPGQTARVRVNTLFLGEFTKPEEIKDFIFTVTNTGDFGVDTYDLTYTSVWPLALFNATSQIALTDTDTDSQIDTGPIAQGSSIDILARVTTPSGLTTGNANTAFVNITSSIDLTKTKTIQLESTIPAAFAQTYSQLQPGLVNLDLNWPNYQTTTNLNHDLSNSYSPAVAETPDFNFINVWSEVIFEESTFKGYILQYTLTDHNGEVLKPITDLTALSEVVDYQSVDMDPAIAVTSNGNIGITWVRQLYNNATSLVNFNIWFAVLNSEGDIIYGPVNLSNNPSWGSYSQQTEVQLASPVIAASADNHFMVSWNSHIQNGENWLREIYYSILQSNGSSIISPIKIADGIEGSLEYYNSSITSLSNNRFLLTYSKWYSTIPNVGALYSMVRLYDSNGINILPETDIGLPGNSMEAIQLSGGNILVATFSNHWDEGILTRTIQYIILNDINFITIFASYDINHPSTSGYLYNLSVTRDNDNHAILSWSDEDNQYLYYALVSGLGQVLSGPAIFHTAQAGNNIQLSWTGYGSTTNSWDSLANVDGVASFDTSLYGASPGGSTGIGLSYSNEGLTTATNSELQLTLGSGLTYTGDTSGITPSIVGNTVTWNLPDLEYEDSGHFNVYVSIPAAAPIGTLYSLDLQLSSDGPESDPSNNSSSAQLMSSEQVFLPLLRR